MIPCVGHRFWNGIERSKFDKHQLRLWTFQFIYFDVGAGKQQKCNVIHEVGWTYHTVHVHTF